MPATGKTPIQLYRTTTAGAKPLVANMTAGEVAINSTDKKLFALDTAGTSVVQVGGGATGGGSDTVFYENGQTVTADYTIATTTNAMSAGPITVNSGVTVTVTAGGIWTII